MHCPNCGALMNRHAEKEFKAPEDSIPFNAGVDGVLAAIHYCPGCGKVEAEVESLQA